MRIEEARPGARIIERHKQAHPRTVVAWENDGFGKTIVVVKNDAGRRTTIKASNISRYNLIQATPA